MSFVPAVFAAIGGGVASAAPFITAAAGISSVIANGRSQKLPALQSGPGAPNKAAIDASEQARIARENQRRTKTILTNPLGDTTGAPTYKKKLFGE